MNTKRMFGFSLLTTVMLTSQQTSAASTDLTINGQIAQGACSITPASSNISYGEIANSSVNRTSSTSLGAKGNDLTITCDAPTLVMFTVTDNREGSVYTGTMSSALPLETRNGLGFDSAGNKIGAYGNYISVNATVNGQSGKLIYSNDKGATWSSPPLTSGDSFAHADLWSFSDSNGKVPVPITQASTNWKVNAALSPGSTLDMTREINLDGSQTIEIIYI
jgi:type 1 fimbria pilin